MLYLLMYIISGFILNMCLHITWQEFSERAENNFSLQAVSILLWPLVIIIPLLYLPIVVLKWTRERK